MYLVTCTQNFTISFVPCEQDFTSSFKPCEKTLTCEWIFTMSFFSYIKVIPKNQYSKLFFSHGSCRYEQDDASHKGMGDDNSNFNLISKYGEEFETTF